MTTSALHLALSAPEQTPCLMRGRPCRIFFLLIAIVILSLADLYITLVYLHSGGMGEANPIARWIMSHGSPAVLAIWKALTVGIAVVILWAARRTRVGEFGAWTCALLLTWLTIRWATYSEQVPHLIPSIHAIGEHEQAKWVTMTP